MKGKAIVPLVLGLAIGLLAVKFGMDALKKAQASNVPVDVIMAVRATQDIDPFARVTEEMVELVETTDNIFVPDDERIEKLEDVIGRVTGKAIPEHSPLLLSMLAPEDTQPGMVGRIRPGYRAVSVKIDEVTGVAYQITPGDWVDVIVVMDVNSGGRRGKETIAEVILQRIEVAAIGRGMVSQEKGSATRKPAKSATLLVPEEDAPKLHLAATRGKITLSMRGDDDTQTASMASARSSELFSGLYRPTPPTTTSLAARPVVRAKPHDVAVYRWSTSGKAKASIEQVTFEHANSSKVIDVSDGLRHGSAQIMRAAGGGRSGRRADSE